MVSTQRQMMEAEEKLNELKQNKERLLKLLKEKEQESELLTKLYSSHSSSHLDANKTDELNHMQAVLFNTPNGQSRQEYNGDAEIENKFVSAEDDFDDALSTERLHLSQRSPSDLLWSQMKKQLGMRESLRNKKKELEDLIRDVNTPPATMPVVTQNQMQEFKEKMFNTFRTRLNGKQNKTTESDGESFEYERNESVNEEEEEEEDGYAENNEIINGYREFFMRKKSAFDLEDGYEKEFLTKLKNKKTENQDAKVKDESECSEEEDEEEEDNDSKNYNFSAENEKKQIRKQQENVLSADKLIKRSIKYVKSKEDKNMNQSSSSDDENELPNAHFDESKPDGELIQVFSNYGMESSDEEKFDFKSNKTLSSKNDKTVKKEGKFCNNCL